MSSYIIEKDKLKGEYSKAFDRVEGYTLVRSIDGDTLEEMLMNLVDILYTAQNDNKPVEKIIGNDIDKFCDDYFSNCNPAKERLKHIPNYIYCMAICCFISCMLDIFLPEEEGSLLNKSVDVFPLVGGMAVGLIFVFIFMFLGKYMWKKFKNISSNLLTGIYIVGVVVSMAVIICMRFDFEILLPLIPTTVISGVVIVINKSIELYRRYKNYGSLKKPQKDGSLKEIFVESYNQEVDKGEYPIELKKQYLKKNKKLAKRGKPTMSPEEYMDYLKVNNKKLGKSMFYLLPFYLIIFIAAVYDVGVDSTWYDTIIFAVILVVLLGVLYLVFYRLDRLMVKKNKELLDRCEAEGITVIELADRIEGENDSGEVD